MLQILFFAIEELIYASLATTSWFHFGIRFVNKKTCCQPPGHLPQLLLFFWLPALPKKKHQIHRGWGELAKSSFLNDGLSVGKVPKTHPVAGGGSFASPEGLQLGNWTLLKILQLMSDWILMVPYRDLFYLLRIMKKHGFEKRCVKLVTQDVGPYFDRDSQV